ncbi:plasminogen-binding N-terminal domain-containing protein [Malaciobacter mytili]|uniref:plasminogen-binding N-terminal domain-containing protein n=1 Tax=Malaciobacter mytili TaxID=603050 RepID=UPI003BB0AE96
MKRVSTKILLATTTIFLSANLSAKTTICYKNEWTKPSTIGKMKLEGGECNSEFSIQEMKEKGWNLKDIKITSGEKGLNYQYVLTTDEIIKIDNKKIVKDIENTKTATTTTVAQNLQNTKDTKKVENTKIVKKYIETPYVQTAFSFEEIYAKLENVQKNEAIINKPNLRIGQSGIVVQRYENGKKIIVSNAYVTSSNGTYSKVKLIPFTDLKQEAIPTSNKTAKDGDILILNYMYNKSLLITPSQDAFQVARAKFGKNTFLHSDIFAAKLKTIREPLPSKGTIQQFAIDQNLGTIFFIIENKAYVVDAKTFAILDTYTLAYNYLDTEKMPFYTRVEDIEKAPFDLIWKSVKELSFLKDLFGDDERSEEEILLEGEMKQDDIVTKNNIYNEYYKSILGLN